MDAISDRSTQAPSVRRYKSVDECHAQATEFLTTLVGCNPVPVAWDATNQLMGHLCVRGRELVVIAPRDDLHRPVVLTVQDWAAVRRDSRAPGALIARCAIVDRTQLVAALST